MVKRHYFESILPSVRDMFGKSNNEHNHIYRSVTVSDDSYTHSYSAVSDFQIELFRLNCPSNCYYFIVWMTRKSFQSYACPLQPRYTNNEQLEIDKQNHTENENHSPTTRSRRKFQDVFSYSSTVISKYRHCGVEL